MRVEKILQNLHVFFYVLSPTRAPSLHRQSFINTQFLSYDQPNPKIFYSKRKSFTDCDLTCFRGVIRSNATG
jgi:hypothetical protein